MSASPSFILPPSLNLAAGCTFEYEWATQGRDELRLKLTIRDEDQRLFCCLSLHLEAARALFETMRLADADDLHAVPAVS